MQSWRIVVLLHSEKRPQCPIVEIVENKTASVRTNFIYKSLLTLSSYIIAFVTFPYASRVLGVERIGLVNFVDNTVGYVLLFATMGVALIGTREVAAVRNDERERSRVYSSILGMNLLFTIVVLAIYALLIFVAPRFAADSHLFWIGSAKILFSALLVEWFYSGMEEFRYITLRNLAIKLLFVAALFWLVDSPEDYTLYFTLLVAMVVVNALVNSGYALTMVRIRFADLISLKYIKKNFTLGIYGIMTSMYLTFNVMYLGFVANDVEVGYYTTAFKLYTIILGFCSAFTGVMMPRLSSLLAQGKMEDFNNAISRSFDGIVRVIIPLSICSVILAPQIIGVLSGSGYEGAILPMRIIMPTAFSVAVAQVLAVQILLPMRHDKIMLLTSICGASVALAINIFVVPHLQSVGSAIVLLTSESLITLIYFIYIRTKRLTTIPLRCIITSLATSTPTIVAALLCSYYIDNPILSLGVALLTGGSAWAALNYRFLLQAIKSR